MIQVDRLRKSFGPVPAVRDISFTRPTARSPGFSARTAPAKRRRSA